MRNAAEFCLALAGVLALIALGGVAVVAGEADDSPGLQGIGVLIVIGATVAALRWRCPRGRGPEVRPAEPGVPGGPGRGSSARP